MAFLESFFGYTGYFFFLVIAGVCGIFAGNVLRNRKDAKIKE